MERWHQPKGPFEERGCSQSAGFPRSIAQRGGHGTSWEQRLAQLSASLQL